MFFKFPFIVLEGTDGSGKAVQTKLLADRLRKRKIPVKTIDFPRYGQPSCYFVERYLRGAYGKKDKVDPYLASLFYALDRWEAKDKIKKWRESGFAVIANRYLVSNSAHQGAKIKKASERLEFYKWVFEFEYGRLGIPRPDVIFLFHLPAEICFKFIGQKEKRKYLKGAKRDIHEKDLNYLKQVEKAYLQVARLFPKDFRVIECLEGERVLSPEEISQKVWDLVARRFKKLSLR